MVATQPQLPARRVLGAETALGMGKIMGNDGNSLQVLECCQCLARSSSGQDKVSNLLCAPRNALLSPPALSLTSSTPPATAVAALLPLPLAVAGSAEAAALLPNACATRTVSAGMFAARKWP